MQERINRGEGDCRGFRGLLTDYLNVAHRGAFYRQGWPLFVWPVKGRKVTKHQPASASIEGLGH